jgi:hypothetical protein
VTGYEVTNVLLAIIGVLLIPAVVLLWRAAVNWTRLTDDVKHIVQNNDQAHQNIVSQMSHDRSVTNERLRYMEEYFMQNGMRPRR